MLQRSGSSSLGIYLLLFWLMQPVEFGKFTLSRLRGCTRERGNHNNHNNYKLSFECKFDLPPRFPLPARNHCDVEQHMPSSQIPVFTGTAIKKDFFR